MTSTDQLVAALERAPAIVVPLVRQADPAILMTEEEANAWAAALRSDSDAGVLFGSSNYYACVARRP